MELKNTLRELRSRKSDPAISILMPTHRTFPDNRQDAIALKNLVRKVEERLHAKMGKREVWPIMEAINAQVDAHDHQYNLDGLAVFAGTDGAQIVKLPFPVMERAIIDSTFATRDLVRGLGDSVDYLLLVLSRESARLIRGHNDHPVHEFDAQTVLQTQSFPIRNDAMEHAGGAQRDMAGNEHNQLRDFINRVDKSVQEIQGKRGNDRLPLIVMADARNAGLYRELCDRPADIAGEVTNAPDLSADAGKLVEAAQPAVAALRADHERQALALLGQARSAHTLVTDLSLIYRAAQTGKAERLFVRRGYQQAGLMDAETFTIAPKDDPTEPGVVDDVVDELIEMVQDAGGEVRFLSAEALADEAPLSLQARY